SDDVVTETVIAALRRILRTADLLFRTADDEFIAVLLNSDRNAALAMASKVTATLGVQLREHLSTRLGLGVACAPDDAKTSEQLVRVARERAANGTNHSLEPPPESIH